MKIFSKLLIVAIIILQTLCFVCFTVSSQTHKNATMSNIENSENTGSSPAMRTIFYGA
jgi:hypothetical protein